MCCCTEYFVFEFVAVFLTVRQFLMVFLVLLYVEMVPQSSPHDTYQALQRAIGAMEEKGMQSDPRYSQLLALRARQVSYGAPGQADPSRVMQVHRPFTVIYMYSIRYRPKEEFFKKV
jgi:hypothetical protein